MDHPVAIETLPEATQKLLRGPAPVKLMAARGMAPLPPIALLSALYALSYDPDEKLASAARATFEKVPPSVLDGAINTAEISPAVLDEVALRMPARRDVIDRVIQHANAAGDTIARVSAHADEAMCELIATNEQRLLAHPAIIEALYLNRALRMSTADRIIELAARNGVELNIPGFKDIAASLKDQLILEPGEESPADEMFREAIEEAQSVEDADEDVVVRDEEGREELKEKFKKVEKRLDQMTLSEKIRIAIIGTASQRLLLVRSPLRAVAVAAIQSPRMQEGEAINIASSRQVGEEILRFIANKREWTRVHQIKIALCSNPKTPVATSLRLLPHLREAELRTLGRSKNVPSALRTAVRQLQEKRANKDG